MMGAKDILTQRSDTWTNQVQNSIYYIYVHLMVIIVYILVPTFV